jgi:hypothetical protein
MQFPFWVASEGRCLIVRMNATAATAARRELSDHEGTLDVEKAKEFEMRLLAHEESGATSTSVRTG